LYQYLLRRGYDCSCFEASIFVLAMTSAKSSVAAMATTALASSAFVLGPGKAVSSSSSLRGSAASHRLVSSTEAAFSSSGVGLLGLGGGAAALLAATQHARGRSAQKSAVTVCAFESELGVQAPVGFWDPAKFTADGDAALFARRRGVELKHGRIAMLAAMGYITPELTGKFPGYLSPSAGLEYQDIPNGLAAISKVPSLGWAQVFGYCAFCETSQAQSKGTPAEIGDFGFKVLTSSDPEAKAKKTCSRDCKWSPCHDGSYRYVFSGRTHWFCLGGLGQLH